MPAEGRITHPNPIKINVQAQAELREQLHLLARHRGVGLSALARLIFTDAVQHAIATSTDAVLVRELQRLEDSSRNHRLEVGTILGSNAA